MLNDLANYARVNNLGDVAGFKSKTARWTFVFTENGNFVDIIKEDKTYPLAPELKHDELIAGGITRSNFLIESVNVIINVDDDRKIKAKHEFFKHMLAEASKYEKSLTFVLDSLKDPEKLENIKRIAIERKVKKGDLSTIRTGQIYPVEQKTWHTWWQSFRSEIKKNKSETFKDDENKFKMVCLLSGEVIVPVLTHNKVMGLSRVGGQPSGSSLIGFDKEAFTSYGLKQSCNAACSEESVISYRNALEDLIKKSPPPIAGSMFLNWYKEPVSKDDNILDSLENPEAEKENARQKANRLIKAVEEGRRPDLAENVYYILQMSANGGRIMLRDWMQGRFIHLVDCIRNWFEDLEIVSPEGKGIANDFKLLAGLIRLVSFRKNEGFDKTYGRINDELASVMPRIWRSIICKLPLPDIVASRSLAYIFSKLINQDEESKDDNLDRISCSLLKAWLLRNKSFKGGMFMKSHLNTEHPSAAYQAGRLMAILADIQHSALGDVGAGIVQRYYSAASATPALVLGRLIRGSQYHLNKLEYGIAYWYEQKLSEVMTKIGNEVPGALSLEGQTLFALGYYQQKAAMYDKKVKQGGDIDVNSKSL